MMTDVHSWQIYGFSRMYPGRQFKDGDGNVSDASVWSRMSLYGLAIQVASNLLMGIDPTLHRLSSPEEVSAIKRRAAPKLFRTRRLANGQVIRTRAGPSVQAKFHEIRDEMAESRRSRALQTVGDPRSSRSYAFDDPGPSAVAPQHRMTVDTNRPHGPMQQQQSPTHSPKTYFWDRGRDHLHQHQPQHQHQQERHNPTARRVSHDASSPLECIQEGIASSWSTAFSSATFDPPPLQSLPVTGELYRHSHGHGLATASFSAVGTLAPADMAPLVTNMSATNLAVQSCPASIHTSPVMRAAELPLDLIPSPLFSTTPSPAFQPLPEPTMLSSISPPQLQLAPLRIAQPGPAVADSYVLSSGSPTEGGLTPSPASLSGLASPSHRDSVASALSAFSALTSQSEESPTLQQGPSNWQGDTIDPRWVSPTTSVWHTPAVTPRSGSPIIGTDPPQFRPYYPAFDHAH